MSNKTTTKMSASEKKYVVTRLDEAFTEARRELIRLSCTPECDRIHEIGGRLRYLRSDGRADPKPASASAVRKVIEAAIAEHQGNLDSYLAKIPVTDLIVNNHHAEITSLVKEREALQKIERAHKARLAKVEARALKAKKDTIDHLMVGGAGLECIASLTETLRKELDTLKSGDSFEERETHLAAREAAEHR